MVGKQLNSSKDNVSEQSVGASVKTACLYFLASVGGIILIFVFSFLFVVAVMHFWGDKDLTYDLSYSDGEALFLQMRFVEEERSKEIREENSQDAGRRERVKLNKVREE